MDYVIKIKLDATYSEDNILKILERGILKGFTYYDQINLEKYFDIPVINSTQAARKIINAYEQDLEGGPAVYTWLDQETNVHLWFYKNKEDEFLEFHIGAFGCPKKKGFYIDFGYYIRVFIDLCDDFCILELKTESF